MTHRRGRPDSRSAAFFAATAIFATSAAAEPAVVDEVESPIVVAGATEFSLNHASLQGGAQEHDSATRAEASYAYLSWWRPGIAAAWQRTDEESELSSVALENLFDFIPTRRWPVHFGAYASYERNMGEGADQVELKLLMQRLRGPLDLRFNIITERETGDHSDNQWEFGYAAQGAYRVSSAWRVGVQGFGDTGVDGQLGDIDDYAHYWGPFTQVRLHSARERELSLHVGYLFGSGHADADAQLRLQLEWSFGEDSDD